MWPRGHKALMTRGWQNVKCLKAWINLKPLEGVFVSPLLPFPAFSSHYIFAYFISHGKKKKSGAYICHWILPYVIVFGFVFCFSIHFQVLIKAFVCVCVWERDTHTKRNRERWPGVCKCASMVYDYMSFVEHINHSCKRNHSEMTNSFRALAGSRKWHWALIYKLKISCLADMHLMKETVFIILVSVCPTLTAFPSPNSVTTVSWLCVDWK